jgi:hypothetical protein
MSSYNQKLLYYNRLLKKYPNDNLLKYKIDKYNYKIKQKGGVECNPEDDFLSDPFKDMDKSTYIQTEHANCYSFNDLKKIIEQDNEINEEAKDAFTGKLLREVYLMDNPRETVMDAYKRLKNSLQPNVNQIEAIPINIYNMNPRELKDLIVDELNSYIYEVYQPNNRITYRRNRDLTNYLGPENIDQVPPHIFVRRLEDLYYFREDHVDILVRFNEDMTHRAILQRIHEILEETKLNNFRELQDLKLQFVLAFGGGEDILQQYDNNMINENSIGKKEQDY